MTGAPDHPRIWLEPFAGEEKTREWHTFCLDAGSTEYIRADLVPDVAAKDAEIARLRAALGRVEEVAPFGIQAIIPKALQP